MTRSATAPMCSVNNNRSSPSSPASTAMAPCATLRQLYGQLLPSQCPDSDVGAQLMDQLSPTSSLAGVHNVEGQFIKAAKNMASVFAGFGYGFHQDNPGVLPTLLTLLLNQCLDQAATVSMARPDRQRLYHRQPFPYRTGLRRTKVESTWCATATSSGSGTTPSASSPPWWPMCAAA